MNNQFVKHSSIYSVQLVVLLLASLVFADGMSVNHLPKFKFAISSYHKAKFQDPLSIFVDKKNKELFIVDGNMSSIFIFDLKGTPIGKLDKNNGLDHPRDMLIRKEMYYVAQAGKTYIEVFDILGSLVKTIKVPDRPFGPGGLYEGFDGRLYVTNKVANELIVFDSNDNFLMAIGSGDSRLLGLSGAAIGHNRVYLFTPFSRGNAIHVYLLNGEYSHSFEALAGYGNGTLGLPVKGLVDKDGNLWLVDSLSGILVYNKEDERINSFGLFEKKGVRKVLQFPIDIDFGMQNEVYILEKSLKQVSIFR